MGRQFWDRAACRECEQLESELDRLRANYSHTQKLKQALQDEVAELRAEIRRLTAECRRLRIACGPSEMIESDYIPDGEGGE